VNRTQLAKIIFRQWWSTRVLNVVLVAVLTMGVVLYLLYGAWQDAARERLSVDSAALELSVPLILLGPDYLARSVEPQLNVFGRFGDHPLVQRGARKLAPLLQTDMLTPFGHLKVTGVPLAAPEVQEALPLVSGSWPQTADGLVLPVDLRVFGWQEGQYVRLGYFDPYRREVRWDDVQLTGYYRPNGMIVTTPIVAEEWLSRLTGLETNGLMLWPREGVTHEQLASLIRDALPGTLELRRPGIRGLVPEREADLSGAGPYRGYSALPYAHSVSLTMYTRSLPERIAQNRLFDVSIPLSKLVVLVLSVVVVGVSLGVLGMLFDQQKNIGVFSAIGMTDDELRWLFGGMFLVDVVASLGLGAGITAAVLGRLGNMMGLTMRLPWAGLALWAFGYAAITLWIGRMVRVFSQESHVPELLCGQARPDFWAFIRL